MVSAKNLSVSQQQAVQSAVYSSLVPRVRAPEHPFTQFYLFPPLLWHFGQIDFGIIHQSHIFDHAKGHATLQPARAALVQREISAGQNQECLDSCYRRWGRQSRDQQGICPVLTMSMKGWLLAIQAILTP